MLFKYLRIFRRDLVTCENDVEALFEVRVLVLETRVVQIRTIFAQSPTFFRTAPTVERRLGHCFQHPDTLGLNFFSRSVAERLTSLLITGRLSEVPSSKLRNW